MCDANTTERIENLKRKHGPERKEKHEVKNKNTDPDEKQKRNLKEIIYKTKYKIKNLWRK